MYKVFLVDDEEITLSQTAETVPWLENGFEVVGTESDPVRALPLIIGLKPEVVFTDLKMPRMDGLELMRRVREGGACPEFVMLSAYSEFEDTRAFFRQSGFDYILKPIRSNEVELLLESLTRRLAAKYPAYTSQDDPSGSAGQSVIEAFDDLTDYIREHFAEHLTVEQLSKRFGLSGSYIFSLFSKKYNTSFSCFVTDLRMNEAKRLIAEGKGSLKSIALACGYKDYFYFSKAFKGYTGMSPMQYKETVNRNEK